MASNDEHVNALRKVLEVIEAAQSGDASKAGNAEWVAWTFLADHGQAILRALSAQQPEAVAGYDDGSGRNRDWRNPAPHAAAALSPTTVIQAQPQGVESPDFRGSYAKAARMMEEASPDPAWTTAYREVAAVPLSQIREKYGTGDLYVAVKSRAAEIRAASIAVAQIKAELRAKDKERARRAAALPREDEIALWRDKEADTFQKYVDANEARLALTAELASLKQACWDARATLGFDNDGDPTPAALTYPTMVELVKRDAAEFRKDYDDALAELASLQRERDGLVRELETARDYVVCALQEERQKFAGYLHCSEVADIANDLSSIDAILNTARGAGNGRGDG